jgi:hypothetical protein
VLLLISTAMLTFGCKQRLNAELLCGDWVRTDGTYQIKITDVFSDGKLNVGYFNPKSIHVVKSNWTEANGIIKIYIELQDENYPGSNYTLYYYPDKDILAGKYFQAVERSTYNIAFMRSK